MLSILALLFIIAAAASAAPAVDNATIVHVARARRQATLDSVTTRAILLNTVPGISYPAFDRPPVTGFRCAPEMGVLPKGGYYADMEAGCASFHVCANGYDYPMTCPKQTLFNQRTLTCDWFFEVNCAQSRDFYAISNRDIGVSLYSQPIAPEIAVGAAPQFYAGAQPQPFAPAGWIDASAPVVMGDALPAAKTRESNDAITQLQQQVHPTSMLVMPDSGRENSVVVLLFVPVTASDNGVGQVEPAEQINSQSMSDAIGSSSSSRQQQQPAAAAQQQRQPLRTSGSSVNAARAPQQNQIIQDRQRQSQQQQRQQQPQQRQNTNDMSSFIRNHQLERDNRPLAPDVFPSLETIQAVQQQQQPLVLHVLSQQQQPQTISSFAARQQQIIPAQQQQSIIRQPQQQQRPQQAARNLQPILSDTVATAAAVPSDQSGIYTAQQQQPQQQMWQQPMPIQSSIVQPPQQPPLYPINQQQMMQPPGFGAEGVGYPGVGGGIGGGIGPGVGGIGAGGIGPGVGIGGGLGAGLGGIAGPGTLLGTMLDGISMPGGVFGVLGQLMNIGPQLISTVLPVGTPMQTLIVPQNIGGGGFGGGIQQPTVAVLRK